jgi:alanine dehydrogenase
LDRLRALDELFEGRVICRASNSTSLEEEVMASDVVVGAVLIPGASAPRVVSRGMLKEMRPKSVLVDVAIDQGGCFETSKPTTHESPTYEVDGIIHYCVANMPGSVPVTSAQALNNATLPFGLALAERGLDALSGDVHLRNGLNVLGGQLTHRAVAEAFGAPWVSAERALGLQ